MRSCVVALRASLAIVLALASVLSLGLRGTAAPGGGEQVTFKSADLSLSAPIPAVVFRPSGAGPFPALVSLHGCDGPDPAHVWAQWLQTQGYVVIVPNSLSARRMTTTCGSQLLTPPSQALDGLGALAYLRGRPDVVATKIGVIGWSHGGAAVLVSASARFIERNRPEGGGYQAAIALYPACGAFQEGKVATPLLMLLGGADDWQPPARCVERGTAAQDAGDPIEFKVYPGATHAFDVPLSDRTRQVPNHGTVHMRYDAGAAADAHSQVQRFLRAHLQ